ncbi:MAG TPA: efflux RND transporter periplasmic adaptor subunit, partial [Smithellaceae bacterium]|nr:efflux RND transporter periplasmic adaptor subunit [Smithellaceae bacterium]
MKRMNGRLIKLLGPLMAGCLLLFPATPAPAEDHSQHGQTAIKAGKEKPAAQPKQPAPAPAADIPQVEISPGQQKRIGVKTVQAVAMPMKKIIRAVGRVEADESRQATVNAKIEAWIEKLYVDRTGSYVKKGAKLAELYSPELIATQQEFLTALKWTRETAASPADGKKAASSDLSGMMARDAAATLEAARQRLLLWDISAGQIRQIEQTGQPVRTLTLYAPV